MSFVYAYFAEEGHRPFQKILLGEILEGSDFIVEPNDDYQILTHNDVVNFCQVYSFEMVDEHDNDLSITEVLDIIQKSPDYNELLVDTNGDIYGNIGYNFAYNEYF